MALGLALVTNASSAVEWEMAPREERYPEYLADPRRPRIGVNILTIIESGIGDEWPVSKTRYDLQVGERIDAVRMAGEDWHVDLFAEAGYFAQFDIVNNLDGIGWDGWYAFHLAYCPHPGWFGKAAFRHFSSHRTDEFVEKTGALRRGYTREDVSLALAWRPNESSTGAYLEGSHITDAGDAPEIEKFAVQFGAQYQSPRVASHRWTWSVGVDVSMFEDNDWEPNVNLFADCRLHDDTGQAFALRFAVYDGRSQLGEFNHLDERHWSIGAGWEF